jgi:hypothetical protein
MRLVLATTNSNRNSEHEKKTLHLTLAASFLLQLNAIHAVEVENLRCEYLKDPLGSHR